MVINVVTQLVAHFTSVINPIRERWRPSPPLPNRPYWQSAPAIVLASVCFLLPALFNGFPFVFPDTADYLSLAARNFRSPFYSIFLHSFHLDHSIWLPVAAQALIASHAIWILVRIHCNASLKVYLLSAIILTSLSSLPYFVSFIEADLMTPVMFIYIYVIGFHFSSLTFSSRLYILSLLIATILVHIANLVMAIGLGALVLALVWLCGASLRIAAQRALLLALPIGLSAAASFSFNALAYRHYSPFSVSGSSFMMANMIEYGPSARFLKNNCPHHFYKICHYSDKFPMTAEAFLWRSGDFWRIGGFGEMKSESSQIVLGTIKERPFDVGVMMLRNFGAALAKHSPGAEFVPYWDQFYLVKLFAVKYDGGTVVAFFESAQNRGRVPRAELRTIDGVVVPVSALLLLGVSTLAFRRGNRVAAALGVVFICSYLGNAALMAVASGVYDRYQARVSWLLVLGATLVTAQVIARVGKSQQAVPLARLYPGKTLEAVHPSLTNPSLLIREDPQK